MFLNKLRFLVFIKFIDLVTATAFETKNYVPTPKRNIISIVAYDADIHGPKAFRMSLEGPAITVTHPNGQFNHEAHLNEMNRLVTRENANNRRLVEADLAYGNQTTDENISEKRKRASTDGIALNAEINYLTEMYTTLSIGTPPQPIPFSFDLQVSHSLVPSSCFDFTPIQKRDTSSTCPATSFGFDASKSTSAVIAPGTFYDTDYVTTTPSTSRLNTRALSGIQIATIKDVIWIGAKVALPVAFWVFGRRNNARLQPPVGLVGAAVVPLAAPILVPALAPALGIPVAVVGLAAVGVVVPVVGVPIPLGAAGQVLLEYFSALGFNYPNWITFNLLNDVINPQPAVPGGRKRATSDTTVTLRSQVLFGGIDSSRYLDTLILFPVVGTTGFSQKLQWQLTLKSIQVSPTITSGSTAAKLQVTSVSQLNSVKISAVPATIQFDVSHEVIYLLPATVDDIYAKITGSRKPTSRNPYYSYICQNTPTISFEFTDTTGTNQLLTLGQANWYQGLSYDGPGFCNGVIQALPTGASVQSMGTSFFRSFCTVLQSDKVTKQAINIGLAVNVQLAS